MSLKQLEEEGIHIEWKAWKMPGDANPPEKPEGYKEEGKVFMKQLLADTGLTIRPPSKKSDTYLAHVGAKFAKEQGVFSEYHQRIFQAIWEKDEDIEQISTLSNIAEEIGLNGEELTDALHDETYKRMVDSNLQEAVDKKIWTIPSYIGNKGEIQVHHFKNLPSMEELKKLL